MKYTYIYGLIDPRNVSIRYVGKSDKPENRLKVHIKESINMNSTYKHNWIKKLLGLNIQPILIILEKVEENKWIDREIFWINRIKEIYGELVTNTTAGGEGSNGLIGRKNSKESIQKMKDAANKITSNGLTVAQNRVSKCLKTFSTIQENGKTLAYNTSLKASTTMKLDIDDNGLDGLQRKKQKADITINKTVMKDGRTQRQHINEKLSNTINSRNNTLTKSEIKKLYSRNKGKKVWNNGFKNIMSIKDPNKINITSGPWVLGKLKRDELHIGQLES